MEYPPTERTGRRLRWVALAALGVGVLVALAILLDLGPFADDPLSEAKFLARGDEVCQQAANDFEELQATSPNTASEAGDLTDQLIGISRDELEQIRDLDAPATLDTVLTRYLDAREQGIEQLQAGLDAANDRDAFKYADSQAKLASDQLHRLQLARDVGFQECSRVLFGRDQLAEDTNPPLSTDPSAPPTVNNPPTGTP